MLRAGKGSVFCGFLAACGSPAPPAAPGASLGVQASATAAPAAPAEETRADTRPVFVPQTSRIPDPNVGYYKPWVGTTVSPDGSLVGFFGPELKLVSTVDGAVRAQYPGCVAAAAFAPEGHSMILLACPEKPPKASDHEVSADKKLLRWDLKTNQVKELASGPFDRIDFTRDHQSIVAIGLDSARVLSAADGTVRHTYEVHKRVWFELHVADDGERALVVDHPTSELFIGDRPPIEASPKADSDSLSPDLRLGAYADGARGKIVIEHLDDHSLVAEARLPDAWPGSFAPVGGLLQVTQKDGEHSRVVILDANAKVVCRSEPEDWSSIQWSLDAKRLLMKSSPGKDETSFGIFDVEHCKRVSTVQIAARLDHFTTNEALSVVADAHPFDRQKTLTVIDPLAGTSRDLPLHGTPRLSGRRKKNLVLGDTELDPVSLVTSTPPVVPIRLARGVLSTTELDSSVVSIASEAPVSRGGLFFVDENGKRTPLAQSTEYSAESPWEVSCSAHANRSSASVVLCQHMGKHQFSIWDANGRRLLEHDGSTADLSADGRRIQASSFATSKEYLIDASSGRDLVTQSFEPAGGPTFISLNRTGSLVAWDGLGVLDATTGKAVAKPPFPFDAWLGETDLIGVHRGSSATRNGWRPGEAYFGPLDIEDARTGKVVASLEFDGTIADQTDDGSVFLTRDANDTFRARDGKTFHEIARLDGYTTAFLSSDGKFVFAQGDDAIIVHRISDAAEIFEVPSDKPGERGLAYTKSGHYDGSDAAIATLRYRVGGIETGKLVPATEGPGDARHPGLVEDFFAGKVVE